MNLLTYLIATSLDGFIARPDGSVPDFIMQGSHADQYVKSLQGFATILMGRKTYEAGYAYGMKPGDVPYPWAKNIVFSNSVKLPVSDNLEVISQDPAEFIQNLKNTDNASKPIGLVGGGMLAASLARAGLLDKIVLKINPIIYGCGISLFGTNPQQAQFKHTKTITHDNGVVVLTYEKP